MAKKCARTFSIVVEKGKKSILARIDGRHLHGLSNRGNCTCDSLSPLTARSDFGADDGGAAPMRMLAPPRTPMIRAYPPDFPLRLRAVPPHLGRQG